MTTTNRALFESKYAEAAETTQYPLTPADSVRTAIDKFTAYNGSAVNAVLTVCLVAQAGTAGATNATVKKTIAPGRTETFPELVGHNLEPGDFISTLCDTASAVVIRASGRQFT
jgi:hypothetical protein